MRRKVNGRREEENGRKGVLRENEGERRGGKGKGGGIGKGKGRRMVGDD